jgi:hypothetical protein
LLLHLSKLLIQFLNLFSIGQLGLGQFIFHLDLAFLAVLLEVCVQSVVEVGKASHLSSEAVWSFLDLILKLFQFGCQLSFLGEELGCLRVVVCGILPYLYFLLEICYQLGVVHSREGMIVL